MLVDLLSVLRPCILSLVWVVGLWCWFGNEAFCNPAFHPGIGDYGQISAGDLDGRFRND